jgi:hypothetical protein
MLGVNRIAGMFRCDSFGMFERIFRASGCSRLGAQIRELFYENQNVYILDQYFAVRRPVPVSEFVNPVLVLLAGGVLLMVPRAVELHSDTLGSNLRRRAWQALEQARKSTREQCGIL